MFKVSRSLGILLSLIFGATAVNAQTSSYGCNLLDQHEDGPFFEGRDGFFYREPDVRMYLPFPERALDLIGALSDALAAHGTTLVFVPVPSKGQVLPEYLPDMTSQLGYDPEVSAELYLHVLDELRARGVYVVDLIAALRDTEAERAVFHQADFHWNATGARLAGQAVGAGLSQLPVYDRLPQRAYETTLVHEMPFNTPLRRRLQEYCANSLPGIVLETWETTPVGEVRIGSDDSGSGIVDLGLGGLAGTLDLGLGETNEPVDLGLGTQTNATSSGVGGGTIDLGLGTPTETVASTQSVQAPAPTPTPVATVDLGLGSPAEQTQTRSGRSSGVVDLSAGNALLLLEAALEEEGQTQTAPMPQPTMDLGLGDPPEPANPAPSAPPSETTGVGIDLGLGTPPAADTSGLIDLGLGGGQEQTTHQSPLAVQSMGVPVVLSGTSYSAQDQGNFAGWIMQFSGLEVLNVSVTGGNQFGSMTSYLTSASFAENPPHILIWETPIYSNLMHFGDGPMYELIAAANRDCGVNLNATVDDEGLLTASLAGYELGPNSIIYADAGRANFASATFRFTTNDGLDREITPHRELRGRPTGRFFAPLAGFEIGELQAVSVDFSRRANAAGSLYLCTL